MSTGATRKWGLYWAIVAVLLAASTVMLLAYTPADEQQGPIQKIFYVHLPVAVNAFLACLIAFIGGVGFLWQRKMAWDDLSASAARVAAGLCTVVLATGMVWGRYAWGQWWVWTPRLTFSLLLWLLYVVYLIVRSSIESPQRRATVCAVYAVAAFLDVPLVYFSTKLMPDIHPSTIQLAPSMQWTLAAWFVPVTLLAVGLIAAGRARNRSRRQRAERLSQQGAWSGPEAPEAAEAAAPAKDS